MPNNLSKRLETVVRFVSKGSYPADIGSDHALVPIALIKRGIVNEVFAVENKIGPFSKMKKTVDREGLSTQITCSFSNGISALPENVNELIIAGMGGELISSILLSNRERLVQINYAVIDAHREYPFLLKTMGELGFLAIDDCFFFDKGKPYCVYRFKNIKKPVFYTPNELFFGPIEIKKKSEPWVAYQKSSLKMKEEILGKSNLPQTIQNRLEEEIKLIKEVISF